ncbi:MAG: hypothetical protein WC124_07450 [Desulfoplanes sp.]|nr:hypothetical protein [Desulfoplanes sp.]
MDINNEQPVNLPHFACEPAPNTHGKAFRDTTVLLKQALCTIWQGLREIGRLTWRFVRLAVLRFWEIRGRCWWSIARDFTKQGYQAVKKDAFKG